MLYVISRIKLIMNSVITAVPARLTEAELMLGEWWVVDGSSGMSTQSSVCFPKGPNNVILNSK